MSRAKRQPSLPCTMDAVRALVALVRLLRLRCGCACVFWGGLQVWCCKGTGRTCTASLRCGCACGLWGCLPMWRWMNTGSTCITRSSESSRFGIEKNDTKKTDSHRKEASFFLCVKLIFHIHPFFKSRERHPFFFVSVNTVCQNIAQKE